MTSLAQTFADTSIRQLNDAFRTKEDGQTMAVDSFLLESVGHLGIAGVLAEIAHYTAFPADDTRHEDGLFLFCGLPIHWHIAYANPALDGPSNAPANPTVTRRVLAIALVQPELPKAGRGSKRGKAPA